MAHDFFMAKPIKDADVCFFSWIFHSWPNGILLKDSQTPDAGFQGRTADHCCYEWCLPKSINVSNRLDRKMPYVAKSSMSKR